MGLIMLDIDNFKRVNDTYGHMQGDLVLREVARVLRESSREIDEPARYGGEEMAVALPGTDLDGAFNFAERVRHAIEALELPLIEGGGTLRVTASFGAAALERDNGEVDKDVARRRGRRRALSGQARRGRTARSEQRPRELSHACGRLDAEMGLLDDAIREHLELKRRRGADAEEVSRQEARGAGSPPAARRVRGRRALCRP